MQSNSMTDRIRISAALTACALGLLVFHGAALAETQQVQVERPSFLAHELVVFGSSASSTWQGFSMQDGEFGRGGSVQRERDFAGLGRRVKAGLLSLLLPGAGQYYNGDRGKALVFAGVEAAVWASYLTFHIQGNNRQDTYEEFAGIYAGVDGDHNDSYWQSVGRYMDSDAYNESILREARAFGETPTGLISEADAWQWRNEERLETYKDLRARANKSHDRRDFMTLFAIINRAVAVFDAVRNSVDDKMSGDVLGFHLDVEVDPSLNNPKTAWTISRNF